jgi:hypothetical protein
MGGPTMTTPIRRADVLRVINNVPMGGSAPRAADLGGGGGLDLNFDTLERIVDLVERIGPLFERFSDKFMAIKDWEQRNGNNGGGIMHLIDQGGAGPSRPPDQTPPVAPPPPPQGPGAMDPLALYQLLLGTLASLPGDMTAAQALDLAKANKPMVLSTIEQHLKTMES